MSVTRKSGLPSVRLRTSRASSAGKRFLAKRRCRYSARSRPSRSSSVSSVAASARDEPLRDRAQRMAARARPPRADTSRARGAGPDPAGRQRATGCRPSTGRSSGGRRARPRAGVSAPRPPRRAPPSRAACARGRVPRSSRAEPLAVVLLDQPRELREPRRRVATEQGPHRLVGARESADRLEDRHVGFRGAELLEALAAGDRRRSAARRDRRDEVLDERGLPGAGFAGHETI